MARFATVAEYNASLSEPLREIADALLPIVESVLPGAGAVYQGHPVWSLGPAPGKSPVCYIKAYSAYVTFGFWRGQEITDRSGRLEANARTMAGVKLRDPAGIDTGLFTEWLQRAQALETPAA